VKSGLEFVESKGKGGGDVNVKGGWKWRGRGSEKKRYLGRRLSWGRVRGALELKGEKTGNISWGEENRVDVG